MHNLIKQNWLGLLLCGVLCFFNFLIFNHLILLIYQIGFCLIWFLTVLIKNTFFKRPALMVGICRVLTPLVTILLIYLSIQVQLTIAMHNAERLGEQCRLYEMDKGIYPNELENLVPDYINRLPQAGLAWYSPEFRYHEGARQPMILWPGPLWNHYIYYIESKTYYESRE